MPKTTTRKTSASAPTFTTPPRAPMTRSDVKEVVEEIVRIAMGQQARELEAHLTNIHERILKLENKR